MTYGVIKDTKTLDTSLHALILSLQWDLCPERYDLQESKG
jgi:hypothetical protein